MRLNKNSLLLYAVTDRSHLNGKTLSESVEEAILGGVTFVQFREKELDGEKLVSDSREILKVCKKHKVPFVINDDANLARLVDADGLHIGQNDIKPAEARKIIGNDKILGVSVQTVAQAIKAEKDGADYLGVGAVFHTDSKTDADYVDLGVLREICESVSVPVVAIGGINSDNVLKLSESGIDGIAVISAIFAAENIFGAAKKLKKQVLKVVEK